MTDHIVQPRPVVQSTPLDQHGAFDYAELEALGIDPADVLDFSVNSNPYGPSPAVRAAIEQAAIDRYPDREALALRRTLAHHLAVSPDQIMAGNGTAELIWLTAFAYLQPDDPVLILAPTFGEYARAARLMGANIIEIRATEDEHFRFNPEAVNTALEHVQPRMVFICNPNNPSGIALPPEQIGVWAQQHPTTLFVFDEAYRQFVPGLKSALMLNRPNILALCSLTKDYAIAGLRSGYAAGAPHIIAALGKVRQPWSVNSIAQAASVVALQDEQHLTETLTALSAERDIFLAELAARGWHPMPSAAHYFILKVGNAAEFRLKLLTHCIQVRDCASFGLPEYVRIATRLPHENKRLLAALDEVAS